MAISKKKKILRQLVQLSQIKKVKRKRKRTKNLNQNAESDQHISD